MRQHTDPRRILTTRDHPLSAALVAAGMVEVGGPQHRVEHFGAMDTKDYPLSKVITETRPDVVVLVDPWRNNVGYSKGAVVKWAQSRDGYGIVGVAVDDPAYWEIARARAHPACVCTIQNFHVYVTNDPGVAAEAAKTRRTALWRPGEPAGHVLQAIRDAIGRVRYVAGVSGLYVA